MATPKEAHTLTSYFGAKYKEKYGVTAKVNRNTARWSWDGMLEDLTSEEIKELIDYYFTTVSGQGHSLPWFFNNYDKLSGAMEATNEDMAALARIREETRRRTEAWKEKNGIK